MAKKKEWNARKDEQKSHQRMTEIYGGGGDEKTRGAALFPFLFCSSSSPFFWLLLPPTLALPTLALPAVAARAVVTEEDDVIA